MLSAFCKFTKTTTSCRKHPAARCCFDPEVVEFYLPGSTKCVKKRLPD